MVIYDVKINGLVNPMGFSYADLVCSWKVRDSKAKKQKFVNIEISDSNEFTAEIYTKSGDSLSSTGETLDLKLKPRTVYHLRVTVVGDDGETGVSEICRFETGKMQQEWQARWIGTSEVDTFHPEIEKNFRLEKDVRDARLYICGLGVFEAYINGKKAGEDYLAPFVNDYKECYQYMTYDVTPHLQQDNRISVILGNGWYKGRLGFEGVRANFGDRFALIAELAITYADGTTEVVATDGSWQYRRSFVLESDIYDGEHQDYQGWESGNPWNPVQILDLPKGKLRERYSMPVLAQECLAVKEQILTPAGETVLDFGQNFAGYVEFLSDLPKGTTIVLDFGEVLQKGNFYNENNRSAKAQFTYVSDGRQRLVHPHFTFFGFRYVRVSGWPGNVSKADFVGRPVYSDLERIGYVETSDSRINRLYENSLWGLKSNFLDIPTDCPQRDERLGWTGDAQVFAKTASYHCDTRAFYNKFLTDLRFDQIRNGGAVANFIPNLTPGSTSSVWGDAATIMPMALHEHFNDGESLKRHYPLMRDWVEYIYKEEFRRSTGHLVSFGFHFGDWLALDGKTDQSLQGGTEICYIATAYYYASVQKVADAAKILGYVEDESHYRELAQEIRQVILEEYFTARGRLAIDTQTAYLIALKFGLHVDRMKLIEGLKTRFGKDGYRIRGGFIGATMMCTVLAENGMEDLAYDFLFFEGFPGWLHCIELGATTIWERWNSILDDGSISGSGMNSLNHYAYGSVVEFLYRYTLGIRPAESGFTKAVLAPVPNARLQYAKGSYDSAAGKYGVEWQINRDGTLDVSLEIPFNCQAAVRLPGYEIEEMALEAGNYHFHYLPKRDYRCPYDRFTRLEQLAGDAAAVQILEEYMPHAAKAIHEMDPEKLTETLENFKHMIFVDLDPARVEKGIELISTIKHQQYESGEGQKS